ncbi:MAG: putative lipoic acid-binding regulatory protein [Cyclobacteriaceae bacterium]|jgi:putative lipoic acid-binding regulatory protein
MFLNLASMSWDIASFKEKIESEHTFPGTYIFKFIVPGLEKDTLIKLLPKGEVTFKQSSNNKYISVTVKAEVSSSDAVIEVYHQAYTIKGIVPL